jgi:MraZ protein
VAEQPTPAPAPAPRGFYTARVDEKGRLKLPVNFQEFIGGEKLFVTSLDARIARLYPISVWQANEKTLSELTDDPDVAEHIAFIADHYGADSEVDSQGRVLLPTDMRREFKLENEQVWLQCFQGAINVYGKEVYEEQERLAKENLADKLKRAKQKGLR